MQYVKKFFAIFLGITFLLSLIFVVGIFAYVGVSGEKKSVPTNPLIETEENDQTNNEDSKNSIMNIPKKTNFLILGISDSPPIADVILIGTFNKDTGAINMLSIPRDSEANIDDELMKDMNKNGIYLPSNLKLNAIYSYANKKGMGAKYTKEYIEKTFGININYTAALDTYAFREIVDMVGGIKMNIRPQGYYYHDPKQDLLIDIKGGEQVLMGEDAEGLIRYRNDYTRADLQRIEVQQEFMKAFVDQVLNKETIINNLGDIVLNTLKYVETDFPASNIPKYIPYLSKINSNLFSIKTVAGETRDDRSGKFYIDYVATEKLIDLVFYTSYTAEELTQPKNLKTQVLNGSKTAGSAGKVAKVLEEDGYNVLNIGNYKGSYKEKTTIITKDHIDVSGLSSYFKDPIIEIDTSNPFYDITIIIGLNENN